MCALNYQPELATGRGLEINLAAIERHLDDDHYVRRFTPGEFVLGGAGAPTHVLVTTASPRWSAIEMPDAATSLAVVSFAKPSEWRAGHLRVTYWYTSPVGSTNAFRIQVLMRAIRDAEVLTGTLLVDLSTNVAGPAVANTVVRAAAVLTTVAIGNDDELFTLRIGRIGADAGDTNVNVFQLLYAKVEHLPAQQVAE